MSKYKNWSAAFLCGAALLSVALVPKNKIEVESESRDAIAGDTSLALKSHNVSKPVTSSSSELDSLNEIEKFRHNVVIDQWLTALKTDAFGDQLIFGSLSTFEPVMNIMKKGVVSYDRKTLRTPNYKDEQGYDLLVYQIHHPLSTESRVMAYYEKREGELPILRIVFLTGRPGVTNGELVQFENGSLVNHREVAWAEAQLIFDKQLSDASMLMSASIH